MKNTMVYMLLSLTALIISCQSKPKVVEEVSFETSPETASFESSTSEVHEVVVKEIMNTKKYAYLSVTEGDETRCLAIPLNPDLEVGATYYYMGGIKMNTFEKMDFKEDFQTVVLVGGVSNIPILGDGIQMGGDAGGQAVAQNIGNMEPINIKDLEGGVELSDLLSNPTAYNGKTIKVKGHCIKVNNHILNRNWVHIQDGSTNAKNEKNDLAITTQENIPMGATVIFEGTITLNKDFGAGYRYDVLMEEAKLAHN